MALQHWYTAASTTAMPVFAQGFGGGYGAAQQLRRLFWQETAGMLVGQFQLETTDYALSFGGGNTGGLYGRALLLKLWRDGSVVQWPLLTQQQGFFYNVNGGGILGIEPAIVQASDGRLGRGIGAQGLLSPGYDDLLIAVDPPAGIYEVDRIWPGDMRKTRLGSVSALAVTNVGLLLLDRGKTVRLRYPGLASAGQFELYEDTSTTSTLVYAHDYSVADYRHGRDLLYLTSSTIGALFRQDNGGAPDTSLPALLRVYDTTSAPYRLLWEDTLPGTDAVAAYDAQRQILYSAPKFAPITLHASRPKRAPTYILGPSLTSDTVLRSVWPTRVQATVQDARSANISATLVQWSLTSQASGGFLTSAYGRTNVSGVATTVYVGPVLSGALTETLSAAVATVE